ncbi:hypothetical protein BSKO_08644 [Bryopsis sp. KO-2023]|nr:hypothetical protein BSKO_08644 [Bryopsis sp. KO-2023]
MEGFNLIDVSAKLSRMLLEYNNLHIHITKVVDKSTFETAPSASSIAANDLWYDDLDHVILSPEEKERCHLKLHRAIGCDGHVHAVAEGLKELCDSGIPLSYEGDRVVDIWVMNTTMFDVSDLPSTSILKLRDPISGVTIRVLSTYEDQDMLRSVGADVCRRVGFGVPEASAAPKAAMTSAPHWWVAAIVEGQGERRMVHVDVCGAAYGDSGFRRQDGELVSLLVFTTPVYELCKSLPKRMVGQDLSHKFLMEPNVSTKEGKIKFLQPLSVRHLRSFHAKDGSSVEVTPLETFVRRRNKNGVLGAKWSRLVAALRDELVLITPPGTGFVVCNLEKRPELNGRKGRVHESVILEPPTDRVPVWVDGVGNPFKLKTNCVRLTTRKQYSSFEQIFQRVQKASRAIEEQIDSVKPVPKKAAAAFSKALKKDAVLAHAWSTLMSGKMTVSFFEDKKFVQGIRKLCSPPFDAVLPPFMMPPLTDGLAVADHPKAAETFAILKMCKTAKLRAMEENPGIVRGGAVQVDKGSDFYQVLTRIAEKVKADPGLTEVFDMMDRNHQFPNPVKQLEHF